MATTMTRHTAVTLAQDFWSRRKPGSLNIHLTVKQVKWLRGLLHDMDRSMPHTHTYTLPVPADETPLALVIYPNGAGFIKVEDFAAEYDHESRQWRIKEQYRGSE